MNKTEFIQQASIRLMASTENGDHWNREKNAEEAVKDALALWNALEKLGYSEEEYDSSLMVVG